MSPDCGRTDKKRTEGKRQGTPQPSSRKVRNPAYRCKYAKKMGEKALRHVSCRQAEPGTEPRAASTATSAASAHRWGALDASHSSYWYLNRAGLITVMPDI